MILATPKICVTSSWELPESPSNCEIAYISFQFFPPIYQKLEMTCLYICGVSSGSSLASHQWKRLQFDFNSDAIVVWHVIHFIIQPCHWIHSIDIWTPRVSCEGGVAHPEHLLRTFTNPTIQTMTTHSQFWAHYLHSEEAPHSFPVANPWVDFSNEKVPIKKGSGTGLAE